MEKIYMEENKNNKKKKSVVDATVVLSFVVAIFAIVSLIAFGINEVSYAEPSDGTTELGSEFTFHTSSEATRPYYYDYNETTAGRDTVVNYLWGDSEDVGLYCIEHGANITNNTAYSRGEEIPDNQLMYILANGENYVKSKGVTNKEAIYWIVQSAIWVHMHNKYGTTDSVKHGLSDVSKITGASAIYKHTMSSNGSISNESVPLGSATATPGAIVNQLVIDAENYQDPIFSINVNACSELETLDNGDKRCLVTVAGKNISSYTVSLINSDLTGVFVSNGDTNELKDHVFNGNEKFYVYIPKAKLPSDESKTVRIFVNAQIEGLDGYVYAAANSNLQKVVTARKTLTPVSDNDEVVVAPDTGINKVQTIYFIGLIVLLCGVGIIYANAKPVEIKQ